METDDQSMQRFRQKCRDAGYRPTMQRAKIFREIMKTEGHPGADTIYENVSAQYPSISRDTVYRTLTLLEELGLLFRVSSLDNRSRFDRRTDQHHHFICIKCNAIYDFECEEADDLSVPDVVHSFGQVESQRLEVRGVCRQCNQDAQEV